MVSDTYHLFSWILGLIVLVMGSNTVIEHCIQVMRKKGFSGGFLGLTVISIGTSLPEITAHLVASINILTDKVPYQVASATVLGTNIGSDIIQQNFIIPIVGLLGFLHVTRHFLNRDFLLMNITAVVVFLFAWNGNIDRIEGLVLVAGYMGYLYFLHADEKRRKQTEIIEGKATKEPTLLHWIMIIFGLFSIVIAGEVMLTSTFIFVEQFALGGSLIGVLIIGVSTALPEMSTAITGIYRKETQISLGTLIGSNITNPALGIGLGAAISTYAVPHAIQWFDLPVKIVTGFVLMMFFWRTFGLQKKEALFTIGMYFAYIIIRVLYFPADIF